MVLHQGVPRARANGLYGQGHEAAHVWTPPLPFRDLSVFALTGHDPARIISRLPAVSLFARLPPGCC